MSEQTTPRLLLVDGSSYLYRAFFAGGDAMSTTLPDGTVQKTGAIRIIINTCNPRWAFASGGGDALCETQTYYTPYVECTGCPSGPFLTLVAGQATVTLTAPLAEVCRQRAQPRADRARIRGQPLREKCHAGPAVEAATRQRRGGDPRRADRRQRARRWHRGVP